MYNPNLPGNPKFIMGDHSTLPAANFPNITCQDAVDHREYFSDGTKWTEFGGPTDFVSLSDQSIPESPYYPENIHAVGYNGKDILAGGCYVSNGTWGNERPYLIRYRNGVWTSLRSLLPWPDGVVIIYAIEWDGEKWWIGGERSGGGTPILFTLDENDVVTDLQAWIPGMNFVDQIKTNGRIMLIGGAGGYTGPPMLFKIVGTTVTNLTASLPDVVNLERIFAIDERDGIWMIGGRMKTGNQGYLVSWDGTTFTNLSANLPNTSLWRGNVASISHSNNLWVFGLIYSTIMTYDGITWTEFDIVTQRAKVDGLMDGSGVTHILWTGYNFIFIIGGDVCIFDGSTYEIINTRFIGRWVTEPYYRHGVLEYTYIYYFIGQPFIGLMADGIYYTFPHGYSIDCQTTCCKRIEGGSILRTIKDPINVERLKSTIGTIGALIVKNRIKLPLITGAGAPSWTGEPGEEYINDTDGKKYWWANGGWRSAGP